MSYTKSDIPLVSFQGPIRNKKISFNRYIINTLISCIQNKNINVQNIEKEYRDEYKCELPCTLYAILQHTKNFVDTFNSSVLFSFCSRQYAIKNILYLIKFVVDKGATLNNSENENNTLIIAIDTGITEVVEYIIALNPYVNNHTMTHAVQTKNLDMLNLISEYGNKVDVSNTKHNTLLQAVLTGSYIIIKKIVMMGGKPPIFKYSNGYIYVNNISSGIDIFNVVSAMFQNCNSQLVDQIVCLLMCSGAVVNDTIYDWIIRKKQHRKLSYCDDLT